MKDPIISVSDLCKSFDGVSAVRGISFTVSRGGFFGFLGPNGAGKTTTINMLTGLARPDSGSIRIAGLDLTAGDRNSRHLIGVVPDESNLYPELTGFDNLCFCGALYGMQGAAVKGRAEHLLEVFGLSEVGRRKFGGYSRGMKRKLTIAAGIVHEPSILFLDEPTTGIDLESARYIRGIIAGLHDQGTTVFLTTHYIEEAERLCSRIAFINKGRIVREDSIENLLAPVHGVSLLRLQCTDSPGEGVLAELSALFPEFVFTPERGNALLVQSEEAFPIAALVRCLEERGLPVLDAVRRKPTLEDVFVSVTGIGSQQMRKEGNP